MQPSSSLDILKQLFTSACSQQQEEARAADIQLGQLSENTGFYTAVAGVVADRNLDSATRLQAILFLKNNVETIWMKIRGHGEESALISEEEKRTIRSLLLSAYNDQSNQMSLHISLVISKIARFDCPLDWPELMSHLANAIDTSMANADITAHQRALFVLYSVVKVLAARRLPAGRRTFHAMCSEVFSPVFGYWKAHLSQAGFSSASSSSAVLCLKSLRYMVLYGFPEPSANATVAEFLSSLATSIRMIVELVATTSDETRENLRKIVLVALKLIGEFQEHSPMDCVQWLASYLELANFCAFDAGAAALPTLAHVRSINIMKMVLLCQEYRISSKAGSTSEDGSARAADVSALFFSAERVRGFCQAMIERYLLLTPDELESWRCEPETYATTENMEAWRHMIRPAAESFLVALVHKCWDELGPMVQQWLELIVRPLNVRDVNEVLSRDALLTAIGLTANDLYEQVDFDSLFINVFLPILTTAAASDAQRILIRRIIWLCGKWIDVKFSKELRPKFYETIIGLVGKPEEDLVIRLTACDALKHAVDEYEFELDSFRPYLNNAVSALINLLRCCTESDSQMQVVTTLWLIAERAGRDLSGNMDAIVTYVPTLWQSENCMLKGQILNLFTQLVKGLGNECHVLLDGLCVMLSTALNPDDSAHVYLLEEGLDLWLALVENISSPLAPQLRSLFRFMPQLLTIQSENLRVCCDIVKAYSLYGDAELANTYLVQLGKLYRTIIGEMRSEGITSVIKVVEMVIRCYRKEALSPMGDIIVWCIETLMAKEETISVKLMCIAIISLVSVQDVQQLYCVMASAMNEEQITAFLKTWLELIGLITHDLERRKCNGLGLCAWLTLPISSIDVLFEQIVSALVDVLFDICIDENGGYVDSLVTYDFGICSNADDTAGFPETEHDKRHQRLRDTDPIYSVSLQTQVVNAFNAKKGMCGPENFDTLWKRVDEDVARNFTKLLSL